MKLLTFSWRTGAAALFASFFILTGCDNSDVTGGNEARVEIEGRVTDDAGYGKTNASIEGAAVTAARVESNGSLRTLEGTASTNAEGRFSLEADAVAEGDVLIVQAAKGAFSSDVLVYVEGSSQTRVQSAPMTTESQAEAAVYVEARGASRTDAPTVADVAVHVTSDVAADIRAGTTTAVDVAAALRSQSEAEAEYVRDEADGYDDEDVDNVQERERASYARLQASLSVSASVSAEQAALVAFEEAMAEAYVEAGIDAETHAKARQAGHRALVSFSSNLSSQARFALRKQAELLTCMASSAAIEAHFRAESTSQASQSAVAEARADLIADLRAATSAEAMGEARAAYESRVETALRTELNIDVVALAAAKTSLAEAEASLNASLSTSTSGEAIASAYASFYSSAEAAVETALATSANASLGADVLVLLSAQ